MSAFPNETQSNAAGDAETVEVHELAKGWKAAIARATDPATR